MDYKGILDNFSDKHILVIGDMMLDHFIWGDVSRISPEAPVPVVDVKSESFLVGGAGNVAHNIVSLGAKATVVGIIGDDQSAKELLRIFKEKNINTEGLFIDDRPTTVKTRVIANHQQVVRFDREGREYLDNSLFNKISKYIAANINSYDAIIVSDYKKGVVDRRLIKLLVRLSQPKGHFIAVDPKVGHFPFYKGVSLITPNKKEAALGSNIDITDKDSLESAGQRLKKTLQCKAVLITTGESGMSLFTDESIDHIPTMARVVYDVTGAGDTVISVFTLSYISGAVMHQAAHISNHAAGIVVGKLGTATVTIDDILKSLL
ncbi:MAG: D-glycero-beta-D-manno-heptose-7-phosphate kinase [Nitrospirae bacterium]|nr:D-glycero-beta-D-manno-heptose-7-phosphate kinase [Nitrospirota bacterium]MBF0539902.1 D-glycero-beta-D-manno-heptose-7-phosphate kinase [Nitrospirota bacterium]